MASQTQPADGGVFPVHLLPLDVVEAICAHLSQHNRAICMHRYVAFTSCCKALWLREDVLASPKLWGYLTVRDYDCHTPSPRQPGPSYNALLSLAAWIRRHRRGLRECELFWRPSGVWFGPPASLLPLTDAMADSALVALHVNFPMEAAFCKELAQLLPRLRALSALSLRASETQQLLPDQLSVLCGLRALSITQFAPPLNGWAPLQGLTALTKLHMEACVLRQLPGELTALKCLASLGLRGNGGEFSWQLLPCLKALTALTLQCCSLTGLPPQLSSLTRLAILNLSDNRDLGYKGYKIISSNSSHEAWVPRSLRAQLSEARRGRKEATVDAWAPLQNLTALTELKLDGCGLSRLPDVLTLLRQLRKLALGGNRVSDSGPGGWEPLAALTALTTLQLSGCGMDHLPSQLSALSALEDLDVSGNTSLFWAEDVWEPVQALSALTRLDVRDCTRLRRPPELPESCRAAQCLRNIKPPWDAPWYPFLREASQCGLLQPSC